MCISGGSSDSESQENVNSERLVSKDRKANNEEAMAAAKDEWKPIHRLLQKLPVGDFVRNLPFNQAGAEALSLAKVAGPMVMTNLLLYSRTIISMLFLGHLGKVELAGGSLAIGLANITGFSIMKGLSLGMDPICGQAFGAKRLSALTQTYHKTLCLLLLVCIPISVLWLNVEPVLRLFGQDRETTKAARVFMAAFVPELIGQAILCPLRTFLRTQGLTTPLTAAAVCAVLLHPVFNYMLTIYFPLGLKGIALALACNTFNLILGLIIYVIASNTPIKPWEGASFISVFQGWRPLLALALPSLVSVCLEWWYYEVLLFLCGYLNNPAESIAAMGILVQTTSLLYNFPYALMSGVSTRVGQALGAGQPANAQLTAIIGILMAAAFGLSATVCMTFIRSEWGKLFTDEPQILELISTVLPILGLCELGNSPQTTACGVLSGTARPKDGLRINLCSFYLVGLPVAVIVSFTLKVGFPGLWFGLLSAQVSCVVMMIYTLNRIDWKHQAKRADQLTLAAGGQDISDLETCLIIEEQ